MVTYKSEVYQYTKNDKGSRKMEIGVSTACFYPEKTENIPKILNKTGVKKAEIFLNSYSEYDEEFCACLRENLCSNGIEVVSVHSFVAMHEPFLFGLYERRKSDALCVYKKVIRAAEILGAKFHTFHGARKEFLNDGFVDFKAFGKDLTLLSEIAGERNVKLALENVSWCMSHRPELIEETLPFIESKNFGFTLDLKQAIRANVDYREYLKVFKDRLLNVHVSDADDKSDCKLPGTGKTDFKEVFVSLKDVGYKGDIIIEVYNNAYESYSEISEAVRYLENVKG